MRTPKPSRGRSRRQEIRTFATTTNALLELRDWLAAEKVTLVVMEATGDYRRGAFYLLEDELNVILVNAAHAKGLPGRKTDVADAAWLCQMGECGLLKASFVRPEPIRHLRDLTRDWWALSSLAVYPATDQEALRPFLCWEKIRVAALARSYGGLCWSGSFGAAADLHRRFSRVALLHEDPLAEVTLPVPLPAGPMPAELGPRWAHLRLGAPNEVVTAVAAVARRMYGQRKCAPGGVEWLLGEQFLTEEPDESTQEFLDDLLDLVFYPRPKHDTTAAIPFVAALAGEDALPAGVRVSVLGTLLTHAVLDDSHAVSSADYLSMQGSTLDARYPNRLRDTVVREVPRLLDRWDQETDPARFLLAALATICPALAADRILPRLPQIPAPEGTARADIVALIAVLLATDMQAIDHALRKVASWHPSLTQDLSSPHTPIVEAARATLASLGLSKTSTTP